MSTLKFYALNSLAPKIVPSSHTRPWMDDTSSKFAYRCLPLNIVNAFGWDMLCPFGITATWDGQNLKESIVITADNPEDSLTHLATSHFGHGVMTFHVSYLVKTEEGWDTMVTGPANNPKHGIIPLSGMVETDWLPFTFTMNWRFTAPGSIRFEAGEPICTLIPIPHHLLDNIVPEIHHISDEPELEKEYKEWAQSRSQFITKLHGGDEETKEQGWQKHYFRGHTPWNPENPHEEHKSKLRLKQPVDKRTPKKNG